MRVTISHTESNLLAVARLPELIDDVLKQNHACETNFKRDFGIELRVCGHFLDVIAVSNAMRTTKR